MPESKRPWSDEQVEEIVGNLLRSGVIAAAIVVLAGGIIHLIRYGGNLPDYAIFRGEPAEFRSVGGIVKAAFALRSRGLIQLGLLLLIATPVARVAFCIYAFVLKRDRLYVIVTLIVLGVLLYSLAGGGAP